MNDFEQSILAEESAAFEQALLTRTISAARRARRTRQVARGGTAAILVACAALLFLPRPEPAATAHQPVAHVAAEPASRLTTFRSKEFTGMIRTQPLPAMRLAATVAGAVPVFRTSEIGPAKIRAINDDQLLALFEGTAVALVGRGPEAQLIFADDSVPSADLP